MVRGLMLSPHRPSRLSIPRIETAIFDRIGQSASQIGIRSSAVCRPHTSLHPLPPPSLSSPRTYRTIYANTMSESSAMKRVKALIQLGCKLLVNTRDLINEVDVSDTIEGDEGLDRKEIEASITFLEKVTTTEIAALRTLQRKQQGDYEYEVEGDSWGTYNIYICVYIY